MFIRFVSCVKSLAELDVHRARKNTGTHMRAPKCGCYSAAECHFFGASFHWLTDGGEYGMFIVFPFHSCKIRSNEGTYRTAPKAG
jgi:hypothetical protein